MVELTAGSLDEIETLEKSTVTAIQDMREDIQMTKLDIARLKAGINDSPTSQGSITISRDKSCYELGDVVHLSGVATPSRQITSSIYMDKEVAEYTPTSQAQSNGQYNIFWVIPNDAEAGNYLVKLSDSGGKTGQITVSVLLSC